MTTFVLSISLASYNVGREVMYWLLGGLEGRTWDHLLLGGPAILPQSLAKMSQMTTALPDRSFSGIGGISTFAHALNYFLLGCGTVQVCTAAMLDRAIGPNVIKALVDGMEQFMEKRGYSSLEDFRGMRRGNVVVHSRIRRPEGKDYHGGFDAEGYAR